MLTNAVRYAQESELEINKLTAEYMFRPGKDLLDGSPPGTAQAALPSGQFPPRFAALVADTSVALLVVSIESCGHSGRLLLENTVNGVDTWLSADMSALIIQNGMLLGTRCVGSELLRMTSRSR